jgi:hypothetical protein
MNIEICTVYSRKKSKKHASKRFGFGCEGRNVNDWLELTRTLQLCLRD